MTDMAIVQAAYLWIFEGLPVHVIAGRLLVSRYHVQWAIDEFKRRARPASQVERRAWA